MGEEKYLSINEFAQRHHVHRNTVGRWIQRGLPTYFIGGIRRIIVDDADQWLRSGVANVSSISNG